MSGDRKRVALVIGAGSVKCAAALGLWKVLKREGIELDMVVGCSGGSLYATLMALGFDVDECEAMTIAMWNRKITQRRDWASMLGAFLPKLFRFKGHFAMVHGEPLIRALREPFGDSEARNAAAAGTSCRALSCAFAAAGVRNSDVGVDVGVETAIAVVSLVTMTAVSC